MDTSIEYIHWLTAGIDDHIAENEFLEWILNWHDTTPRTRSN